MLRTIIQIVVGLLIVAFAVAPFLLSSYELNLTGRFLALGLTAIGLALLWGHGGILSLGQGVFFGLGGYALAMHLKLVGLYGGETMPDFMVWTGLKELPAFWAPFKNPLFALLAVILLPGVVAAGFGWLVFRRRIGGVYFALITQALALAFATLLISQQAYTGGFNGLTNYSTLLGFRLADPNVSRAIYWITLVIVIAALIGCHFLLTSRYGQLLRATRDGANRMRFLGYSPTPYQIIAFTVAAILSGISGALFTLHSGVISPALVGVVPSIEMVIWAAIGGRQSIYGALAGALLVNFAKDKISTAFPEFWLYVLGAAFIIVVTLAPKGLAGAFEGLHLKPKAAKKSVPQAEPAAPPPQPAE